MGRRSDDEQIKAYVAEADRSALPDIQRRYPRLNAAVQAVSEIDEADLQAIGWIQTPVELRRFKAAITSANYIAYGKDATKEDLELITELTALAVRARRRAQHQSKVDEFLFDPGTKWTRRQALRTAWAKRQLRKRREECRRIGLGGVGTTHNQASAPTHHGSGSTALKKKETEKNILKNHEAKLKWARCLINKPIKSNYSNKYPDTSRELRWARGFHNNPALDGEDADTTPEPSESDDSEGPEETRRLEVEALRQEEQIRRLEQQELSEYRKRFERIEESPGDPPRPTGQTTRSPRRTGEPEEGGIELVEFQRRLAETERGPEEIRRLEQGAARRPLNSTNEGYYRTLQEENEPTDNRRPRARLERRVEEYLNERESGGEDRFTRITWTLVIVVLVVTGCLGFATIFISELQKRSLRHEDVFHQGSEGNETSIAQTGWNATSLGGFGESGPVTETDEP